MHDTVIDVERGDAERRALLYRFCCSTLLEKREAHIATSNRHVVLGCVFDGNINSPTFGAIANAAPPRIGHVAMKVRF